ncbi:MAG: MBL fold metallo-hydrolase [Luteolibacter sp.]
MKISSYTGGFVETNGYLIETPEGNLLIDAPAGIRQWLKDRGVRVDHLLLTHQHYDHVEDVSALQADGVKVHAFAPYSKTLTLENLGLPLSVKPYTVDSIFDLSQPLALAGRTIRLAHVPGHSTDSVTFYFPENALLFSGDTIFAGSIGRSDLPGGSTKQLLDGIAEKLLVLPGMTQVFPGHGPSTTIDSEIRENPFL